MGKLTEHAYSFYILKSEVFWVCYLTMRILHSGCLEIVQPEVSSTWKNPGIKDNNETEVWGKHVTHLGIFMYGSELIVCFLIN